MISVMLHLYQGPMIIFPCAELRLGKGILVLAMQAEKLCKTVEVLVPGLLDGRDTESRSITTPPAPKGRC